MLLVALIVFFELLEIGKYFILHAYIEGVKKSLINTKNLLSDIALSPIKTSNGELT